MSIPECHTILALYPFIRELVNIYFYLRTKYSSVLWALRLNEVLLLVWSAFLLFSMLRHQKWQMVCTRLTFVFIDTALLVQATSRCFHVILQSWFCLVPHIEQVWRTRHLLSFTLELTFSLSNLKQISCGLGRMLQWKLWKRKKS